MLIVNVNKDIEKALKQYKRKFIKKFERLQVLSKKEINESLNNLKNLTKTSTSQKNQFSAGLKLKKPFMLKTSSAIKMTNNIIYFFY